MHLQWEWLSLAVFSEFASMAAVARSQRRLLRAGGARLPLGSVMAVTNAGNAVSVSLPGAGPQIGAAFSFRQFGRRGVDSAVVAWALAVSGSSRRWRSRPHSAQPAAVAPGCVSRADGWVVALVPAVGTIVALRSSIVRRCLKWVIVAAAGVVRRPGLASSLDSFPERLVSVRLPRLQYAELLGLAVWNGVGWLSACASMNR
jgi:hypothetical protein